MINCCFLKLSAGPVIGAKEGGVAGFFKGGLGGIVAGTAVCYLRYLHPALFAHCSVGVLQQCESSNMYILRACRCMYVYILCAHICSNTACMLLCINMQAHKIYRYNTCLRSMRRHDACLNVYSYLYT
jgi:hypothetical protein